MMRQNETLINWFDIGSVMGIKPRVIVTVSKLSNEIVPLFCVVLFGLCALSPHFLPKTWRDADYIKDARGLVQS